MFEVEMMNLLMATAADADAAGSWADPAPIRFVGRLHPLFVHFPIGLIMVACVAEVMSVIFRRQRRPSVFALQCLAFGAAGALFAAGAGWINAEVEPQSAANADLLLWHRWLGVAAAGISLLTLMIGALSRDADGRLGVRMYRLLLLLGTGCIAVGGHFGGELVYGQGYVFEVFASGDDDADEVAERPEDPTVVRTVDYETQIRPILEAACWHCHGAEKGKGGLRMHEVQRLFQGDEEHWAIQPGDPDGSLILQRMELPADDLDLMPADADRLPDEQLALIRTWIEEGAYVAPAASGADDILSSDGATEAQNATDDAVGSNDQARVGGGSADAFGLAPLDAEQAEAYTAALEALRQMGATATPIAGTTHGVDVNFAVMSRPARESDLEALTGLESSLVWLNLAGSEIGAGAVDRLAAFGELRRLHVENSAMDDAAIERMAASGSFQKLEYLNLYGCGLTDAGVDHLGDLPALRNVYLWQTSVTESGVAALQERLPSASIVAAIESPVAPAEAEASGESSGESGESGESGKSSDTSSG